MSETIIIALISLIGGGGLSGIITWQISRRKANAEADRVEIDNEGTVGEQWKAMYEALRDEQKFVKDAHGAELDRTVSQHNAEIERIKVQYNAAYAELKSKEESLQSKLDSWVDRDNAKQEKIDSLYDELTKHRDEKSSLHQDVLKLKDTITDLKLKIAHLETMKCEVHGCINRRPPSEAMM